MTLVLWVICDVEMDGDTHLHIWPKVRSSSCEIGQILKIVFEYFVKYFKNIPIMSSIDLVVQKCHLFCHTTLRNTKNRVSKSDFITLAWFLGHCKAKNKGIGLKLCRLVVHVRIALSYMLLSWISSKF